MRKHEVRRAEFDRYNRTLWRVGSKSRYGSTLHTLRTRRASTCRRSNRKPASPQRTHRLSIPRGKTRVEVCHRTTRSNTTASTLVLVCTAVQPATCGFSRGFCIPFFSQQAMAVKWESFAYSGCKCFSFGPGGKKIQLSFPCVSCCLTDWTSLTSFPPPLPVVILGPVARKDRLFRLGAQTF